MPYCAGLHALVVWDDTSFFFFFPSMLICIQKLCCSMVNGSGRSSVEGRGRSGNEEWICSEWSRGWRRGHVLAASLHRTEIQVNMYKALKIQTSQVWQLLWLLLPPSLITVLSCSSSPGPEGEKSFSWSNGPGILWRSLTRRVESSAWALACFPCITFYARGNWSCWHIPVFFPPSIIILPAYLLCLHLCSFLLTV